MNAFAQQTKWITDQRYVSSVPGGIWRDRVSKADRKCQLTDREVARKLGETDGYGNLPPQNMQQAAKLLIERLMNSMSSAQQAAISPRVKWQAIDLMAAGKGNESFRLLLA